jgi:hypothetical protein
MENDNQKSTELRIGSSSQLMILDELQNGVKIRDQKNFDKIKDALRHVFFLIGLKVDQLPVGYQMEVLLNFIKDKYPNNSPGEIRIAFELALKKEFECDLNHYGTFSALYFSSVFNAYTEYRSKINFQLEIDKRKKQEMEKNAIRNQEALKFEQESLGIYRTSLKHGEWLGDIFNASAIAKRYIEPHVSEKVQQTLKEESEIEYNQYRKALEKDKNVFNAFSGKTENRIYAQKLVEFGVMTDLKI